MLLRHFLYQEDIKRISRGISYIGSLAASQPRSLGSFRDLGQLCPRLVLVTLDPLSRGLVGSLLRSETHSNRAANPKELSKCKSINPSLLTKAKDATTRVHV